VTLVSGPPATATGAATATGPATTGPATAAPAGDAAPPAFDGNDYRKVVLAPLLAAGVVTLDDPFRLVGLSIDCDDTALLRARLAEVVGFWQRERNSPRYKGLVSELVRRRPELEAVLFDPQQRALARLRVQGARRAQETARAARLDRLLKAVAARHGGVPRSRLVLLRRLAAREGVGADVLAARLAAYPVLEDGTGVQPLAEGLRVQVRASLDELALRGDRARAASLWAFLGLPASSSADEIVTRHAALVGENLARAHDRDKTVRGELLAHVKALLVEPGARASYAAALLGEAQERITDRVLELAVVDGELWPPDVDLLVREVVAGGTGLTADQAKAAVRAAAAAVDVPVTLARSAAPVACPSCGHGEVGATYAGGGAPPSAPAGRLGPPAAFPPVSPPPASWSAGPAPGTGGVAPDVRAHAQEEWRQVEREVGLRRLVHASQRLQRLQRGAPDLAGPSGALPAQRLAELARAVTAARGATELALTHADPAAREAALYAVLAEVADLGEASAALAEVPVSPPSTVTAMLAGTTMRLRWSAPPSARGMTYSVTRVTRAADGSRVEHGLGMTTRCEQLDPDLPHAALVWHEIIAAVGSRRSQVVATEPQPVVPDVSGLRAAQGPAADGTVVVTLTWSAPPGNDVVVERHPLAEPDAAMRRARARGSRWTDSDVVAGGRYRYVVRVEAAVGGVVARTPGCTVDVSVDAPPVAAAAAPTVPTAGPATPPVAPASPSAAGGGGGLPDWLPLRSAAAPAVLGGAASVVQLALTPVPPGVVATWTAPRGVAVTLLAGTAVVGPPGSVVDLEALPAGLRVVGSAVGPGSAYDARPELAVVFTPVAVLGGVAVLGEPVRHVTVAGVDALRAEGHAHGARVWWSFPPGCGEALVVWRSDRAPVDATDAEGGEVVGAERLAAGGGWQLPQGLGGGPLHLLVLPVVHLAGEPVLGPGASLRVG